MTHETQHTIGQNELIDFLLDTFAETFLSRDLTAVERREVTELAQRRIDEIRGDTRRSVQRELLEKSELTPPELARAWGVSPDMAHPKKS
ncbi:MAG: hypothetical protein KDA80_18620, partial [Planctomycetaceae bacterium]|nr:hypothetical protein [Planctomycetaceae bacterium]